MLKKTFLLSTSLTLAAAVSMPAVAQDFEDEIIVTATKREQTLQEVPVAVTVTSADTIEKAAISDILDLQTVVPSLRVTQLQNSVQTNFIIRGFGNGANNAGIEPSVGVFIDGVYRSRSAGALSDLPNLERVEVLRGPQSTLFGKNASAGVISVVTAAPSYETEGYIQGSIGNYNHRAMKGYISGGLGENIAASLGGSITQRDGYYDNLETGVASNDRDRWGVRGQVLFEPADDLTFRIIGDYDKIDEICCGVGNIIAGPTADIITGGGSLIDINNGLAALGAPASSLLTTAQLGGLGQRLVPNDLYAYEGFYDFDPTNELENKGASFHIDYDVNDDIAIKSITSYREQDILFDGDVDFTGARLVEQNVQDTKSKSFTQELRVEGTSGDFDWMAGGFYFEDDLETDTLITFGDEFRAFGDYNVWLLQALPFLESGGTVAPPSALGVPINFLETLFGIFGTNVDSFAAGQGIGVGFTQKNESLSLFAQGDLHLGERITLTGGAAYVEDRKEVTSRSDYNNDFSQLEIAGGLFGALVPLQFLPPFQDFPNEVEGNTTRDDKFTYTAKVAYEAADNINVYGSIATGFKASTWNLSRDSRPLAADHAELESRSLLVPNQTIGTRFAGPENSTVYELGVKAKLDRGYVNVTVFDQTIKGFQSNVFTGTGFNLANAGSQSAQGIEFDFSYSPIDNLNLAGGAIFMDPIYDSFPGAAGPGGTVIDLTGERPGGIHKASWNLNGTYDFNFMNRDGYVRLDWLHEGETPVVENVRAEEVGQNAFRKVDSINASMGMDLTDQVNLQFWGRNLFNDEYPLSIFPSVAQAGSFSGYPNAPRTYGASLRVDFD